MNGQGKIMLLFERNCRLLAFTLVLGVVFLSGSTYGQDQGQASAGDVKPLALKEEMIRDRYERFRDRVYRLREQLAEVEPENAARLGRVLERSGELGLADQLDEIIRLLRESSSLTDTLDAQARWLEDADRLLSILRERDSDNEERRQEIDRLGEHRQDLSRILEQEQALRDASAQAGRTRQMAKQLDQAIQRLEALRNRQAQVTADSADPSKARELGDQQDELSQDTRQLADDIGRLAESEPDAAADSTEAQAAQQEARDAADAVQQGAQAMSAAGEGLRKRDPETANEQQRAAEDALRRARDRLEQAKKELEGSSATSDLAEGQRQVAQETEKLGQRLRSEQQAPGQPGSSGQPGESPPGSQSLDQAQRDMDDAAESLDRRKPDEAAKAQDEAIEDLQQAMRELEDMLTQMRQEEREETLRDLESRFREMLSEQRGINTATITLAEQGRDSFGRAQQLELADLAATERRLSERAATCVHILDEEGTTVVFPRVVGQLAEDMGAVADRLAELRVGPLTQGIEQEIIETLEQLLGALKRMQQENEQQQGGSMSGDNENSPLLPTSAEYKLLRSSQVRVNTRTIAIEGARTDQSEPVEALTRELADAATRQAQCAEIAREMRDRQKHP